MIIDLFIIFSGKYYYRFRSDENAEGPSAIEVSGCGSMKGNLFKKGKIKWNERYVVLRPDEGKLYVFDSNTVRFYFFIFLY